MKLYTFVLEGIERLGAQNDDGNMVDLLAASGGDDRFASMLSLIRSGEMGLELARRLIVNAEAGAVFCNGRALACSSDTASTQVARLLNIRGASAAVGRGRGPQAR